MADISQSADAEGLQHCNEIIHTVSRMPDGIDNMFGRWFHLDTIVPFSSPSGRLYHLRVFTFKSNHKGMLLEAQSRKQGIAKAPVN